MINSLELKAPNTVELNLAEMEQTNGGSDLGRAVGQALGYAFGQLVNGAVAAGSFFMEALALEQEPRSKWFRG